MVEPGDVRRYDEKQFALILRKAAELQARDVRRPMGAGLSLQEIEGIAAEAGIEPRFVRQALGAVTAETPGTMARIAGYPYRLHAQHVVPGELDHATLSMIVDVLQTEYGRPGTAREVLGGIEWNARDQLGRVHASVRKTGTGTRIHVVADRSETAAVLGTLAPIGGLIAGGVVAGIVDAPTGIVTAAIVANGVLAGLAVARAAWAGVANKWRQRMDTVLERVLHTIPAPAPASQQIADAATDPRQRMTPQT
jgi:hypothetical protein